jgi:tRNA (guanine-N7-)-methyltransferase
MVVELFHCNLHFDYSNVYKEVTVAEELRIKTHYELMDIAGSNRIHYLCFSLPPQLPGTEKDEILKKLLTDGALN